MRDVRELKEDGDEGNERLSRAKGVETLGPARSRTTKKANAPSFRRSDSEVNENAAGNPLHLHEINRIANVRARET
jgi:hypothetical protein